MFRKRMCAVCIFRGRVVNRVYIAAPLLRAADCRYVARLLAEREVETCSTWHATEERTDPWSELARVQILAANLSDLDRSDLVLALTTHYVPRATFSEVGYAIAQGKRVVWLHAADGTGRQMFDAHHLVSRVTSMESALAAVEAWAKVDDGRWSA